MNKLLKQYIFLPNWHVFFRVPANSLLAFCFLANAMAPNVAHAAKISDCLGFGGTKACFEPDNPKAEGPYKKPIYSTDACARINRVGGKAHDSWKYEIVEAGKNPTLTGNPLNVNTCTNLPFTNGGHPRLYTAVIGCSYDAELVDSGSSMLCVPRTDLAPKKNLGKSCRTQCGNPINFATGNKYQEEVDYYAPHGLVFVRYYNSTPTEILDDISTESIGKNWRHNFKYFIKISGYSSNVVIVYRPDEREYLFYNEVPADPSSKWTSDGGIKDKLVRVFDEIGNANGWEYQRSSDDATEVYGNDGNVKKIKYRNGLYNHFLYSDMRTSGDIAQSVGLLINVIDSYGREIRFFYNSENKIIKIVDPSGGEYRYAYDEGPVSELNMPKAGNLTSITFPDGDVRRYLYNEKNMTDERKYISALTGIIDENGDRFASFTYGPYNLAYSTEHGGGVNKYSVNYGFSRKAIVTEPLGIKRVYDISSIFQIGDNLGESQQSAVGIGVKSRTFDSNGNVASEVYFDGIRNEFVYDLSRNLEVKRIEAKGSLISRFVTTRWHKSFHLPIAVAEPMRLTQYTYDERGNLILKTIQGTFDKNGELGFDANLAGGVRKWNYEYNSLSQMVKSVDPLGAKNIFLYDDEGNLVSVTNSLGQSTLLRNYDRNGRAGEVVYPNGLIETRSYTSRGWLKNRMIGSRGWRYEYDGAGQLAIVTLPDDTFIKHEYDTAHRLVKISDNMGNSISYILDVAGNRVSEETKDSSGNLAQRVARVFNALSQMKEQSGGIR